MLIYKVTSPSGKVYIGKTSRSLDKRWKEHQWRAKNGSLFPLHQSIRKHGPEKFQAEEIFHPFDSQDADFFEMYFIVHHKSMIPGVGYNCTFGGDGMVLTEETLKRRPSRKGLPGIPKSSEQRKRMSEIMSGRIRSESHCKNMSLAQQGEKSHRHRLTEKEVLNIRQEYIPRKVSRQLLADKYNVSRSTIQDVVERKTWSYL